MLVIGISGHELDAREREWLQHDAVAGVILFTRNFASRSQVADLSAAIRAAAPRPQLLCVDQEGGRVQRFRDGYHPLPSLDGYGQLYARDPKAALRLAKDHAWLMASEIRATGVDLSFAPVVDLGRGNLAIGNRAFHADPAIVAEFTRAYVAGMHEAGMAATLKHFPGHGSVLEDTHFDDAVDPRPLDVLQAEDLLPFVAGIEAGADAVMMAHVEVPGGRAGAGGLFAALGSRTSVRRDTGLPRRRLLRRHRHGRGRVRGRGQGAHRRPPRCRLRRRAGLPAGPGRGFAAGHGCAPRVGFAAHQQPDRARRRRLGRPAGRCTLR